MNWGRTVGHNRPRALAYPDEILAAIDAALAENPLKEEVSAMKLAETVVRYIPLHKAKIAEFILKRMTTEQRKERNITEPRPHVRPVGTLTNKR